jgi:hypothetical protein
MNANHNLDPSSLTLKIHEATQAQNLAVEEFFAACDKALNEESEMRIYMEVAYLLGSGVVPLKMWDWIEAKAQHANLKTREVIRIAILELIPEPPLNMVDLVELWLRSQKRTTRWMLQAAYLNYPKKLKLHQQKVEKRFLQRGIRLSLETS